MFRVIQVVGHTEAIGRSGVRFPAVFIISIGKIFELSLSFVDLMSIEMIVMIALNLRNLRIIDESHWEKN